MNSRMIFYILGHVLRVEGILMLLPGICGLIYHESEAFIFFLIAVLSILFGYLTTWKIPSNKTIYLKEGCVATGLSWILMSVVGALPFYLTRDIPSYIDALFETISGFTTTGASILTNVEALSHCALFWRSFTHWIGGMGVLVFLLAVLPLTGGSNINLMRAESPGPSVGKLVPKIHTTAMWLYGIYFGLTILEIIILLISRMPVFDTILISFGTAGTGGFGIRNSSCTDYTMAQQWIITVFMILFGVNFNSYYFILLKKAKKAIRIDEIRVYFAIIFISAITITFQILPSVKKLSTALCQAFFQVGSIITTTGFATADFDQWNNLCKTILVTLMFCGACSGSTGGGIKVSRILILFKSVKKELHSYLHPRSIRKINMDGKSLDDDTVRSTNVYFTTFFTLFTISLFLVSIEGKDLITNFTAVAATINNIGPGLNAVGPTQNFASFGSLSKLVLMIDMLAGRLELFPILLLFAPNVWESILTRKKHV